MLKILRGQSDFKSIPKFQNLGKNLRLPLPEFRKLLYALWTSFYSTHCLTFFLELLELRKTFPCLPILPIHPCDLTILHDLTLTSHRPGCTSDTLTLKVTLTSILETFLDSSPKKPPASMILSKAGGSASSQSESLQVKDPGLLIVNLICLATILF